MIEDSRIRQLAKNLVGYSCNVQAGENVMIEATGVDYTLVGALVEEIYRVGGYPHVVLKDARIERKLLMGMTKEHARQMAKLDSLRMEQMQAYIGLRGGDNAYETSDVPSDRMRIYDTEYAHPVHHERRVKHTKWVILRYPTPGMSAMSAMSTEAFEDLYFRVCNLDYRKMDEAMTPLVERMNRTDRVRIVGPDTDLEFSIRGIGAVKCSGLRNIPDGEVYTAPVRDSVNGVIHYNVPTSKNGKKYEDIRLVFRNGKIVEATGNDTDALNAVFDTDEGARYVGEFALGVNPYIERPMGDILFDEKISGSIHFTPGCCYDDAYNGNVSAIHWDLVLIQTPQAGGGEIYFDGELIRKDGRFVPQDLQGLNPENLK